MPLEFTKVTRAHPCPACNKDSWCEVGEKAVLCQRVESDHPNQSKNCGGWFHFYEDNSFVKLRPMPSRPKSAPIDADAILAGWRNGKSGGEIADDISLLAGTLGVATESMVSLEATWSKFHMAWAFPMRDSRGRSIGIRLRANDGRKWAVTGSRSGIFFNPDDETWLRETALICEGPTDTAAALTLGFPAIGKPCCNSGNDYVIEVLRRLRPARVVIVSDVDSMQKEGIGFKEALKLQQQVRIRSVVWAPQAKDLREFLKFGGTRQLIESEIGKMLWKS